MPPAVMRLDDLPVEVLEEVLTYCSLIDLHRSCMIVSRKWLNVTRCVLKKRKTLNIVDKSERSRLDNNWDLVIVSDKTDTNLMISSLVKMTGVQVLTMDRWSPFYAGKRLIVHKAADLTALFVSGSIPRAPEYTRLERLGCENFVSGEVAAACPRLRYLHVSDESDASALTKIPPETLVILKLEVVSVPAGKARDLVDHLLQMQDLEVLELRQVYLMDESDVGHVFRLFPGFPRLHHLQIGSKSFDEQDTGLLDSAIADLVRLHPGLRHVDLRGVWMGEQGLASLSQLRHLTFLSLESVQLPENRADAVIRFLRESASRTRLKEFAVSLKSPVEREVIMAEIDLIEQERGQVMLSKVSIGGLIQFRF